ncbi:MAG: SDR family NAD(P)-dependent oxidoreductase, partial [Acidimicrobiia bacterium]|nr:SDR family NAD(P)-dependent oxidoreductase [Acidimicrobiia bacterium]
MTVEPLATGLEGSRALVTGGGTGIGRAIALQLASCGAKVAVLGRHSETLEATVDEIRRSDGEALWCVADIRDEDAVASAFEAIEEAWGGLDILVNNAGGQFPKLAIDMSISGWRSVVDLNLTGTFICSLAFARSAVAHDSGGTIINITTAAAVRPSRGLAHAVSARSGVIAMTKALA